MRIFVFLHVLTMFSAVALSGGVEILAVQIAKTGDARAIRTSFEAHQRLIRFIPVLFLIGLAFGLIAVFVNEFNPFAPWLLLAYPLFVAGILTGAVGIGPWLDAVGHAAAAAGDDTTPELKAAIADPRGRYSQIAFWLLTAAIVFVMVMKPLS